MRKVTKLEAETISEAHRNAVWHAENGRNEDYRIQWMGVAHGIVSTLKMLDIRFSRRADGGIDFIDVEL